MLAQTEDHLANAMARAQLQDGRNMLAGFHTTGKLTKASIQIVEMTPTTQTHELERAKRAYCRTKRCNLADPAVANPQK